MTTSCTDWDHPYYEQLKGKDFQDKVKFFSENNGKRMRFVSLGETLDFVSWGGGNFVAYDLGTEQMVAFIRNWIKSQQSRIKYEEVPLSENSYRLKVKKREWKYLWNRFQHDFPVELPRIDYGVCPRNLNHKGTLTDLGRNIRCAHIGISEGFKPSFIGQEIIFDVHSRMDRISFWDMPPGHNYNQENERYREEDWEFAKNPCYALITEDPEKYLPLQTVLDRINCSSSFSSEKNFTAHPFSGFGLANYVQAWWKQPGKKQLWRKKDEKDSFKFFASFQPFSNEA